MLIGIILMLIVLLIAFSYYYFKLISRIYLLFSVDISKSKKRLFVFLGIIIGIISFNMFNFTGIFLIHFILISLLFDLIVFVIRKFVLINNKNIFIKVYKICIVPFIITLVLFVYGYFNIRNIVETKYTINVGMEENLRILLITDSHYGNILKKNNLEKIKDDLDKVDADIVLLGGDIVDEYTDKAEMKYIFNFFSNIKNKYGIYYIYGNHDKQRYKSIPSYTDDELENEILLNDIKILKDEYLEIRNNVVLVGRNDKSLGRKSVKDVLSGVDKDDYIIMLDHQPLDYVEVEKNGVDLILSGHTHGGQIFPIGLFIDWFKTADLSYGHEKVNNMNAIVSSGFSGWGYPIRTQAHSEYVVIDLK